MSTWRGYLNTKQLESLTGLGLDDDAAVAAINKAEAIVDGYIGYWDKLIDQIEGITQSGNATSITLDAADISGLAGKDYFKGCMIEFLSGDNEGAVAVVTGSTELGVVSFATQDNAPAAGDYYIIRQVGKIPRRGESDMLDQQVSGVRTYFRRIPQALKEAVAAQVEYMQQQGDSFFNSAAIGMDSERIDDYSYNRGESTKGGKAMLAPKARQVLSGTGIINRGGRIVTGG